MEVQSIIRENAGTGTDPEALAAELAAAGCRVDETGFGGFRIVQDGGFRYGIDAVLLAAFAAGETGAHAIRKNGSPKVLDLGTGNGIVPVILAHKRRDAVFTGVEVQEQAIRCARLGVRLNGLEDRITLVKSNILDLEDPRSGLIGTFDAVCTNPPYFRRGAAIESAASAKRIARHETTAVLRDFLRIAAKVLVPEGSFYMVHRPDRLTEILMGMHEVGIEPKALQLVAPRTGEAANLVLVHGILGAGPDLRILPEILVREETGAYTPLIERIYERNPGQ